MPTTVSGVGHVVLAGGDVYGDAVAGVGAQDRGCAHSRDGTVVGILQAARGRLTCAKAQRVHDEAITVRKLTWATVNV